MRSPYRKVLCVLQNKIGRCFLWLMKCIAAAITAVCIISVFCFFFYNPPIHVPSEDGLTDFVREENSFWSRLTEGFAMGRVDENGYNNPPDSDHNVDVVCMGSSQTEGENINLNETYTYLCNDLLNEAGIALHLYNIGMSSHSLEKLAYHEKNVLEKYHPRYIVMETRESFFSKESVEMVLSGENELFNSYSKGEVLYWLQKIPFVKLMYWQIKQYLNNSENENIASVQTRDLSDNYADILLEHISSVAEEYNCTPIILFLPGIAVTENKVCREAKFKGYFSSLCENNNIIFLDMTEAFDTDYRNNYHVPTGFSNTAVGYGHFNKWGHKQIAEQLFQTLTLCESW